MSDTPPLVCTQQPLHVDHLRVHRHLLQGDCVLVLDAGEAKSTIWRTTCIGQHPHRADSILPQQCQNKPHIPPPCTLTHSLPPIPILAHALPLLLRPTLLGLSRCLHLSQLSRLLSSSCSSSSASSSFSNPSAIILRPGPLIASSLSLSLSLLLARSLSLIGGEAYDGAVAEAHLLHNEV